MTKLEATAKEIRINTVKAIFNAGSGHYGASLSCVEILTALYFNQLQLEDRFVLSKGHAAPALYATLAQGTPSFPKEELMTLRKMGSRLQGHPDMRKLKHLDAGTGALGQGLSIASGYALASRLKGDRGVAYCLVGDGELQEGQIWEAVAGIERLGLNNIVCIVDHNGFQNDGPCPTDDIAQHPNNSGAGRISNKFRAFGMSAVDVDGHDMTAMTNILSTRPSNANLALIAHTVKGKGVSFMENNNAWHGGIMNMEQYAQAMEELK